MPPKNINDFFSPVSTDVAHQSIDELIALNTLEEAGESSGLSDINYKALRDEIIGFNNPKKIGDIGYQMDEDEGSNTELDKLLNVFYENPAYTNIASKFIRGANILGHADVPFAKELTEQLDNIAHRFATRHDKGAGMGWTGYTGTTAMAGMGDEGKQRTPNMMKIFLGQEENVFPESEIKPSSYTKGDPQQGWSSIKDYSKVSFNTDWDAFDFAGDEDMKAIKKLKKAVDTGTYNVDEHAVKLTDPGGIGIDFKTSVDLGNFTTSLGYDEEKKQYFVSITDVWDFRPEMYADVYGPELLPEVIKGEGRWSRDSYPWKGKLDSAGNVFESYEDYLEDWNWERSKLTTEASFLQATGESVGVYDRYYLPKDYSDDLQEYFK